MDTTQKIDKYAQQHKYQKENCKKMTFEFNKTTDKDVLDYLDQCGNKRNTILTALREYMKNHQ